ncbi:MAG: hypothetical protein JSU60_08160, partial [Nitrospirota bacterium]
GRNGNGASGTALSGKNRRAFRNPSKLSIRSDLLPTFELTENFLLKQTFALMCLDVRDFFPYPLRDGFVSP